MNYASIIMSLIALGVSLTVILADPNVSESKDGFCHQTVKSGGDELCVNEKALTATDSQGNTKDLCITPQLANKC